jgi:AraC-like DNA-binding protein
MKNIPYKISTPTSSILKDLIASIYIVEKGTAIKNYFVYPHTNCNLSLFFGANINIEGYKVIIDKAVSNIYSSIIAKRTKCFLEIEYVNNNFYEIAINFKPLGISCFSDFSFDSKNNFYNLSLFNIEDQQKILDLLERKEDNKIFKIIENLLLQKYKPIPKLNYLVNAVKLLQDFENKISITDLSKIIHLNQKQLNRYFNKYVGCSPAHFRRIERFRRSIQEYLNPELENTLTKLAYKFEYSDQAHLINEFKKLTSYSPKKFFKNLSVFANGKILWKVI